MVVAYVCMGLLGSGILRHGSSPVFSALLFPCPAVWGLRILGVKGLGLQLFALRRFFLLVSSGGLRRICQAWAGFQWSCWPALNSSTCRNTAQTSTTESRTLKP